LEIGEGVGKEGSQHGKEREKAEEKGWRGRGLTDAGEVVGEHESVSVPANSKTQRWGAVSVLATPLSRASSPRVLSVKRRSGLRGGPAEEGGRGSVGGDEELSVQRLW